VILEEPTVILPETQAYLTTEKIETVKCPNKECDKRHLAQRKTRKSCVACHKPLDPEDPYYTTAPVTKSPAFTSEPPKPKFTPVYTPRPFSITEFCYALRWGRERMGMSQTELAKSTGVDKDLISEIERGLREPTPEIADQLSRGLLMPSADQLWSSYQDSFITS